MLTACQFGNTTAEAEGIARDKIQTELDSYRTVFAERLQGGESAADLRTAIPEDLVTLRTSYIGADVDDLRERFGEELAGLVSVGGNGDEVTTDIFIASTGNAGGGGSYSQTRLFACISVSGKEGEVELVTEVVPCPDVIVDSLVRPQDKEVGKEDLG